MTLHGIQTNTCLRHSSSSLDVLEVLSLWKLPAFSDICPTSQAVVILCWTEILNGLNYLTLCQSIVIVTMQWYTQIMHTSKPMTLTKQKLKLQHFMYILWCILWTSWPFKTGPLHCPQTSVSNQHTLRNNPQDQRSWDEVGYLGYSKVMLFSLGSEYFSICELFFNFTPFSNTWSLIYQKT